MNAETRPPKGAGREAVTLTATDEKSTAEVPRSTGLHQYLPEDMPTHHYWPISGDFDSNADAALYWAGAGFQVAPEGTTDFTRDPNTITALWAARPYAMVRALPPVGTFGLYSVTRDLRALERGTQLLCDGAPQSWHAFKPHWRDDLDSDPVTDTFAVLGLLDCDVEVRIFKGEATGFHHFPRGMQLLTEPLPMPCPSLPSAYSRGVFQPIPPHIRLLMQPEPLPCSEQDLKGYPCRECARYSNARTAAEQRAAHAEYLESYLHGIDVWERAEELGWGSWS